MPLDPHTEPDTEQLTGEHTADPGPPPESTFHLPATCGAPTRAGTPCGFAARRESGLCINHDPAYRTQQRQHRLDGAARSLAARREPPIAWADLDLSNRTLVRALSLAIRNFDTISAMARRQGAVARHPAADFDAARRRCTNALDALLPPTPDTTP